MLCWCFRPTSSGHLRIWFFPCLLLFLAWFPKLRIHNHVLPHLWQSLRPPLMVSELIDQFQPFWTAKIIFLWVEQAKERDLHVSVNESCCEHYLSCFGLDGCSAHTQAWHRLVIFLLWTSDVGEKRMGKLQGWERIMWEKCSWRRTGFLKTSRVWHWLTGDGILFVSKIYCTADGARKDFYC